MTRSSSPRAAAALLAAVASPLAPAQFQSAPGFQHDTIDVTQPFAFPGGLDLLPGGNPVLFDGVSLVELDRSTGQVLRTLFTPPPATFGAFVAVSPSADAVLFGESSQHTIRRVPLDGSPVTLVATVQFNYDAVFYDSERALISRGKPGFAETDIVLLDVSSGSVDVIATVPGPSGPLTIDSAGNLIYGENSPTFPAPPGSARVYYWTATQVAGAIGPGVLSELDATPLFTGPTAITDLAIDRRGDLIVSDSIAGRVAQYNVFGLEKSPIGEESSPFGAPTYLAFEPGTALLAFDPYQPPNAGTLIAISSDFTSASELVEITPRRAELHSAPPPPVPVGPFQLTVEHGPPLGSMFLFAATGGSPGIVASNQGIPFLFELDPGSLLPLGWLPLDAAGELAVPGQNPGLQLTIHLQGALLSSANYALGTTTALKLSFQ